MQTCPLCCCSDIDFYHQDNKRRYWQCRRCQLVFVEAGHLPSANIEQAEYHLHQNQLDDLGYRQFLNRLAAPLLTKLNKSSVGLDFGCGPTPLLAKILEEQGHKMQLYDPFFQTEHNWHQRKFDFICCSEAIEHFHTPHIEWATWLDRLKIGGWLAIMTKRVISQQRFTNWHYKNDVTHVSFFSEATFNWLAAQHQMKIEFSDTDVVLMQKTQEVACS